MSRYIIYEEEESIMILEDESKCSLRRNGTCYCNSNIVKFGKKCAGDIACIFFEKEDMKRGEVVKDRRRRICTKERLEY